MYVYSEYVHMCLLSNSNMYLCFYLYTLSHINILICVPTGRGGGGGGGGAPAPAGGQFPNMGAGHQVDIHIIACLCTVITAIIYTRKYK